MAKKMEDYGEYHNKERVRLLVDARTLMREGYTKLSNPLVSLELSCKIIGESNTHILLEDVLPINNRALEIVASDTSRFRRAKINKDYIIGVFEE